MVDRSLTCTRKDENGKRICNGVMHLVGHETRGVKLKYICDRCGHEDVRERPKGAGKQTFDLGITGDPLRSGIK